MKKVYFYALILLTVTLLILFIFYNRYSSYYKEEQTNEYISKNIDILNENIEFEKRYALSLSLFISKNSNIKRALSSNNQKLALKEINAFLKEIKETTKIDNIDIQIHTKELKAFARNWESSGYYGLPLEGFRKGLVRVKRSKTPFVSIELGKRLNIKAISPILDYNSNFLGSIEVIIGFKNIKERLKKFNLFIIGLLDKKYINIATDLKGNDRVDRYYVVEKSYPKELYNQLKNEPKILSGDKPFYIFNNRVIAKIPMQSVGIENVGIIVLSMGIKRDSNVEQTIYSIEQENSSYKFNKKPREVIIK